MRCLSAVFRFEFRVLVLILNLNAKLKRSIKHLIIYYARIDGKV